MSPMNVNHLAINWAPETGKTYVITLNLVEKLTSEFLLDKLKEQPKISVDITKLMSWYYDLISRENSIK